MKRLAIALSLFATSAFAQTPPINLTPSSGQTIISPTIVNPTITDGTGDNLSITVAGPSWSPGLKEFLFSTTAAGGANVFSVQNLSAAGYSAITLRDNANREIGAFASAGNAGTSTGGSFFGSTCISGTAGECTVPPTTVFRQDWDDYTETATFTGVTAGNALTTSSEVGTINVGDQLYYGNSTGGGYGLPTGFTIASGSGHAWVLSGTPSPAYPSQVMATTSPTAQSLTTTRFMWQDAGSRNLKFLQGTPWGGQGLTTGLQIAYSGGVAIADNTSSGVSLKVGRGSVAASRDNSSGCPNAGFWSSDCSIGDLVAVRSSPNAPAVGWMIQGKHKMKAELEGGSAGPYHLDFVDIDNSNQVPLSLNMDGTKNVTIGGSLTFSSVADSTTAPTIASGGCTTGATQTITANGTAAFDILLGGATCGSTITLTLPAATNKWHCTADDVTTPATNLVAQTAAASTTSVVLTNFVRTTGVAGNFTATDHLVGSCRAL